MRRAGRSTPTPQAPSDYLPSPEKNNHYCPPPASLIVVSSRSSAERRHTGEKLRPPAGRLLLPSCNQSAACGQRRPPLRKVAKAQNGVRLPASVNVRKCVAASDHGSHLRASEYIDEPLLLAVVRDFAADLRGLVAFLAEQPRQLKYLEWPGFQNTFKTATLTLILVAVFIVALSTVDAALCYILAWLLQKSS